MERQVPAATVISMVPFPIDEVKPGMTPSKFHLDPAPFDGFTTLLIHKCQHGVYLDQFRPVLIVPTAPEEVAEAICLDYKKGQLGILMNEAEPGLFWVPGDFSTPESHKQLVAMAAADFRSAKEKQIAWFKAIVAMADDIWNKFHQRGMVSSMQRLAATYLKLERGWLLDDEVKQSMSECSVCFEKVNPNAIVCRHCGAILNQTEYDKRKFTTATK